MQAGVFNDWSFDATELEPEVPVLPGTKLYAWSRRGEADGVVWPSDGQVHMVYHDVLDWNQWTYVAFEMPVISNTPMAACGRIGYYGVFWPGDGQINLMYA